MPSVPWQRCLFHLCQNAQHHVPTQGLKNELGQAVKHIYLSLSKEEARKRKEEIVLKYQNKAEKICTWLEENFEEGLNFYSFDRSYWKKIRTVNQVESLNKEIRRRTNIVKLFPHEESCLRLISAVVLDKHEDGVSGKQYLKLKD